MTADSRRSSSAIDGLANGRRLPARRARPGADLLGHARRLRPVRRRRRVRGAQPRRVRDRPHAADDRAGRDARRARRRAPRSRRLVRRGESRAFRARRRLWGVLPARAVPLAWAIAGRTACRRRCRSRRRCCSSCRSRRCVARVALQPIADASVLVLLIVSLALHFLLSGLGLLFFGPEGLAHQPLAERHLRSPAASRVSGQVLLMVARGGRAERALLPRSSSAPIAGKALRATAVNRIGARLVGIRPARTALLAYGCASLLAGPDRRADRAGDDDVLRLGLHHRPEGVRRRDHRRPGQLSADRDRRARGRPGRELRVVLERRAEGRDRLQPADPGAAAALVLARARARKNEEIDT